MRALINLAILFLAITGLSVILLQQGNIQFGNTSFWHVHGIFFLIFITFFPRLTLVFATPIGGLAWWLGWIFAPRLLVAILATIAYWNTNPILVMIAWIFALGGETGEKYYLQQRIKPRFWR